jgi:hypothetical protein
MMAKPTAFLLADRNVSMTLRQPTSRFRLG